VEKHVQLRNDFSSQVYNIRFSFFQERVTESIGLALLLNIDQFQSERHFFSTDMINIDSKSWKNIFIPFSERKRYTEAKRCLKFVRPSQSETSFSIFHLFDVLIKLYYRLSTSRNPNLRSDFLFKLSLIGNCTLKKLDTLLNPLKKVPELSKSFQMHPKLKKNDKKTTRPLMILTVFRGGEPSGTKPFFKFRTAEKHFVDKY